MSTKKKALQHASQIPTLANCYADAHEEVYGKRPYIHSSQYGRFRVFEDELREYGYSPLKYARTVVKVLKKWAAARGLATIPINVFTGDWALKKFRAVIGSEYVRIAGMDIGDELYWSEMTVARAYVADNISDGAVISFSKMVGELIPILTDLWLDRYYDGGDRPTISVLEDLCDEYNIVFAKNYADLVRQIRGRIVSI